LPGFPKQNRLLNAREFQSVFDKPDLRLSHPNFLILCRDNSQTCSRLGMVIAKKNLRLATQRNRIKRLIRETFRHEQHQFHHLDVIVLARRNLDTLDNPEIAKILNKQWRRIVKKQSQPAHTSEKPTAKA
jgi:ribonuclease P protein component